jgi:hypothetical protein
VARQRRWARRTVGVSPCNRKPGPFRPEGVRTVALLPVPARCAATLAAVLAAGLAGACSTAPAPAAATAPSATGTAGPSPSTPGRSGEIAVPGSGMRYRAAPPGTVHAIDEAAAERVAADAVGTAVSRPEVMLVLLAEGGPPPGAPGRPRPAWLFVYRDTPPFASSGPPGSLPLQQPVRCETATIVDATTAASLSTAQSCSAPR